MGKAGALQPDGERLRGLTGAEGHLVVDLVGVDFPVVAGRRLERHRHRRRLARRALAGERVVDEVEPPRRLRALRCDGDSRGRHRHRDRFGRAARSRLGIAPIVDEARPHPDRLALVGPDQRVGLPGRAGDVPVPVPVDADPLVGVHRRRHPVEVVDIPGRGSQRFAHSRRARNRGPARRPARVHFGIVADRYGEARRVIAGFVLDRVGVVAGVWVGVGDRNHLAPADGRGGTESENPSKVLDDFGDRYRTAVGGDDQCTGWSSVHLVNVFVKPQGKYSSRRPHSVGECFIHLRRRGVAGIDDCELRIPRTAADGERHRIDRRPVEPGAGPGVASGAGSERRVGEFVNLAAHMQHESASQRLRQPVVQSEHEALTGGHHPGRDRVVAVARREVLVGECPGPGERRQRLGESVRDRRSLKPQRTHGHVARPERRRIGRVRGRADRRHVRRPRRHRRARERPLVKAQVVGERNRHLHPLALVVLGQRVGARGRAGDVGRVRRAVRIHPDPLVAVDRPGEPVAVRDGVGARAQGLADPGRPRNPRRAGRRRVRLAQVQRAARRP